MNLKGNNITDTWLVAISSCISNIEKLSGIEKIAFSNNSSLKIPELVEIVKKTDEPVIMKIIFNEIEFKTKIEKGTLFKKYITISIEQTPKFTEDNAKSRTTTNYQLHA